MTDSKLPSPARASATGPNEKIKHRAAWRLVHVGFDMVYVAGYALLVLITVHVVAVTLLGIEPLLVPPLALLEQPQPTPVVVMSGVMTLAWLVVLAGTLLLARAPGHRNLKAYGLVAAGLVLAGILVSGWFAFVGFAAGVLYMHGLGRAWYYETLRRHAVVLLFAWGVLALVLVLVGTGIPPAFAFGTVMTQAWHDRLPFGSEVTLLTILLPWWLWGPWLLHVVRLARHVTAVIQHPKPPTTQPSETSKRDASTGDERLATSSG